VKRIRPILVISFLLLAVCGALSQSERSFADLLQGADYDGPDSRELQRPEERPEALAAPDRVDHARVVGGETVERLPQLLGEGAAALDDLGLRAKLAAGHRPGA